MKIAVLSGKGGTGKTTVSNNLAINIKNTILIDTDVEEPNSHIFLKPDIEKIDSVFIGYPEVDMNKCNLCGKCGEFCRFNAIIPAKNSVVVFNESCHDCGGCAMVCPTNAITYKQREIGKIYSGKTKYDIDMKYGEINIGEMSGVRIIEEVKEKIKNEEIVIIDSPPGTACSTVAAVEGVDYAILVSEPTPFGVSDMKMVVEMLREMNIPFGLVINKAKLGDDEIYEYANNENIEILAEIPFNKEIAKLYANGELFSIHLKEYKEIFENIYSQILSKL
ncbi:MinD superfamily P-loop ATPase [Hypnocyclicus thermotrophus]|uniref:MinD superfamily P-loop ATPase n=1 Tax=Hypnocyclicus thermotrophus TaxID=1627895 RepID=A0AA46DZN6_9FUSO|nr:ATP-binding protein [Hypnocyclicus thermotrophus]TDT71948.1 MinD superfamily P-loop ATPase [Hypnocyclicus thermotrophus]